MPLALPDLQAAFAAHMVGNDRADLVASVVGDSIRAAARLRVYRHHVCHSLATALSATFPTVRALVGDTFFGGLARAFVASTLPTQPVLSEYGEGFAGFVAGYAPASGLPYLADIARLDWTLNAAFHSPVEPRLGVADLAASLRARTVSIGGLNPDYPGDQWHAALSRMVTACRAYGLRPIDGPYGDFKDPDGFLAAARRAAALGYEGKWAIHPSQIAPANDVFTPPAGEIERAQRILRALDDAAREGRGAAQLEGRMIDAASARLARNVVQIAAAIDAKRAPSLADARA